MTLSLRKPSQQQVSLKEKPPVSANILVMTPNPAVTRRQKPVKKNTNINILLFFHDWVFKNIVPEAVPQVVCLFK